MQESGHILIINPGSTSTKLGVFEYISKTEELRRLDKILLDHSSDGINQPGPVLDQLPIRLQAAQSFIELGKYEIQLIMCRSAPLQPLEGGIYSVNEEMLKVLRAGTYSNHASNLAALMGEAIGKELNVPVFISDPITTDEMLDVARVSGVPEIQRKSRCHALNLKASTRKICAKHNIPFMNSNWVVCHMGGGISVAALRDGRIIDVNDALLGMGPFSPERAGALPISGLLDLAYSDEFERHALETKLSQTSGLKGYLGTSDLQEVEQLIHNGNEDAKLVYDAMVYQINKEIGAMASVHAFRLNGIILTGGMAHSKNLCLAISNSIKNIADIYVEPGENELQALAEAGFRVIREEEQVKCYHLEARTG